MKATFIEQNITAHCHGMATTKLHIFTFCGGFCKTSDILALYKLLSVLINVYNSEPVTSYDMKNVIIIDIDQNIFLAFKVIQIRVTWRIDIWAIRTLKTGRWGNNRSSNHAAPRVHQVVEHLLLPVMTRRYLFEVSPVCNKRRKWFYCIYNQWTVCKIGVRCDSSLVSFAFMHCIRTDEYRKIAW